MTRGRRAAHRIAPHLCLPSAVRRAAPRLFAVSALALAVFGAGAQACAAQGTSLDIREIQTQSRHTYRYTCANGKTFKVTYINGTNQQSFALVPVEGRNLLFVGVIAASGVKYVAERYVWWTKGPGADLYDAMSEDGSKAILSGCATIMR